MHDHNHEAQGWDFKLVKIVIALAAALVLVTYFVVGHMNTLSVERSTASHPDQKGESQ